MIFNPLTLKYLYNFKTSLDLFPSIDLLTLILDNSVFIDIHMLELILFSYKPNKIYLLDYIKINFRKYKAGDRWILFSIKFSTDISDIVWENRKNSPITIGIENNIINEISECNKDELKVIYENLEKHEEEIENEKYKCINKKIEINETINKETINKKIEINETINKEIDINEKYKCINKKIEINETINKEIDINESINKETINKEIEINETINKETINKDTCINDTCINDTCINDKCINKKSINKEICINENNDKYIHISNGNINDGNSIKCINENINNKPKNILYDELFIHVDKENLNYSNRFNNLIDKIINKVGNMKKLEITNLLNKIQNSKIEDLVNLILIRLYHIINENNNNNNKNSEYNNKNNKNNKNKNNSEYINEYNNNSEYINEYNNNNSEYNNNNNKNKNNNKNIYDNNKNIYENINDNINERQFKQKKIKRNKNQIGFNSEPDLPINLEHSKLIKKSINNTLKFKEIEIEKFISNEKYIPLDLSNAYFVYNRNNIRKYTLRKRDDLINPLQLQLIKLYDQKRPVIYRKKPEIIKFVHSYKKIPQIISYDQDSSEEWELNNEKGISSDEITESDDYDETTSEANEWIEKDSSETEIPRNIKKPIIIFDKVKIKVNFKSGKYKNANLIKSNIISENLLKDIKRELNEGISHDRIALEFNISSEAINKLT